MNSKLRAALADAMRHLLYPLIRIAVRCGLPYAAVAEVTKKVYVDVTAREFAAPGRKASQSQVAIRTGLTRKEVKRLSELGDVDSRLLVEKHDRATRVVSGWLRNEEYRDSLGRPLVLPFEGAGPSFSQLVRAYGGDVPARALLDELLRARTVEVGDDRQVALIQRGYVPRGEEEEMLRIVGTDVADLISCMDHNLAVSASASDSPADPVQAPAFFQRKVAYDNLPAECLPELRALANRHGQELLELLDRWLAEHDRDDHPEIEGTGRFRAMLGIYYYENDTEGNRD